MSERKRLVGKGDRRSLQQGGDLPKQVLGMGRRGGGGRGEKEGVVELNFWKTR